MTARPPTAEHAARLRVLPSQLRSRYSFGPDDFPLLHQAADAIDALLDELAAAREALAEIAEHQPRTLEKLRAHGVVFDGIGNDPKNWQHVAFSIYTDLCEVDSIARTALADGKSC